MHDKPSFKGTLRYKRCLVPASGSILNSDDYDRWLDPDVTASDDVQDLLRPYPGGMRAHPISRLVNNARHDGLELTAAA